MRTSSQDSELDLLALTALGAVLVKISNQAGLSPGDLCGNRDVCLKEIMRTSDTDLPLPPQDIGYSEATVCLTFPRRPYFLPPMQLDEEIDVHVKLKGIKSSSVQEKDISLEAIITGATRDICVSSSRWCMNFTNGTIVYKDQQK